MKYKNIIIDTSTKSIYHCITVDNNKKVKIVETNSFDENTKITINQKYRKSETIIFISQTYLLLRYVTLPKVSENSIYDAAKFSLEEFYPGENIRNYTVGYSVVNSDNKNIFLVVWGIKKGLLQNLLNKYSDFNIVYVSPTFVLPLTYFNACKVKDCLYISFLFPNEVVFLIYEDSLKSITVRSISESFYSYDSLRNLPSETLSKVVINFLRLNNFNKDANICLFPYVEGLFNDLTSNGYRVDNKNQSESDTAYLNGVAFVSEKESLLKEEFKKVEPYVKTFYHILFLMFILLFTLVPLYYVKKYDYNKNRTDIIRIRDEFVNLYRSVTQNKWDNFNKSYSEVKRRIADLEDALAVSKDFPVQSSSLEVLQQVFLIPQIKDITILKLTTNIIQKNCAIRALTLKRESIELIIESLKSQGFDAKLNGSVISKEDGSLEFEIIAKW